MASPDQEILYVSSLVAAIFKSPTWVSPIAKFVDDNCGDFEDQEENKLEYTFVHNAFKWLIDELLEAHFQELAVTPEQFQRFCQHGLSSDNEFHRELVEQLLSVDDFLIFKAMMVKRNAQLYKQALDEYGFGMRGASAPPEALVVDAGAPTPEQQAAELEAQVRAEEAELEAERLELQRKCVEAELQLAMALSMQFKKRLALMEALSEVLESLAQMSAGVEEAMAAEAMVEAPVHVQPLYAVADAAPEPAEQEVAAQQRERAEHAVAHSRAAAAEREAAREAEARAAAAAAPAARAGPTEEERRQRAEHLKRQRDLLLQRKNQEREQQLHVHKQTRGPTKASKVAEGAFARPSAPSSPSAAGQRLAAELSGKPPEPDPAAEAHAAASAGAEMRRTLTQQLRQTFTGYGQ